MRLHNTIRERNRARKRLSHLLALADDEEFVRMVWAIDALQSDRVGDASRFISYPSEAASSDLSSSRAIFKWELETLVGQLLLTAKKVRNKRKQIKLNCSTFSAVGELINVIRRVDDLDSIISIESGRDVFLEMHRIGHRQFPWQRGYLNKVQFYRNVFVYGGDECGDFFKKNYGLTINEFNAIGFALFAAFQRHPSLRLPLDFSFLGLEKEAVDAALKLLTAPIKTVASRARELETAARPNDGSSFPIAFLPSAIREYPILRFSDRIDRISCPLPALIVGRVTSGIYYDLVAGPSRLRNEAGRRFEMYSQELLSACFPNFQVSGSFRFKEIGTHRDSPDVFVKNNGALAAVIECKATKLSHKAQFFDDPALEAKRSYDEISKAVFQLWRFYSANRRKLFATMPVDGQTASIVLTMDNWLQMSRDLKEEVLRNAHLMADGDIQIEAADRKQVIFCSIEELEQILLNVDEYTFLKVLAVSSEDPQFEGWLLPSIVQKLALKLETPKPYPFDLDSVLPWWKIVELHESRRGAKPPRFYAAVPNT